jgi:phage terminase small subunit
MKAVWHKYIHAQRTPPLSTLLNDKKKDPSHRRRNTTEPEPPSGAPVMPQHVADDDIARQEWGSVCQHLDSIGLLAKTDRTAIDWFAKTNSRYRQAEGKVEQFGDVILSPHKAYGESSDAGLGGEPFRLDQALGKLPAREFDLICED